MFRQISQQIWCLIYRSIIYTKSPYRASYFNRRSILSSLCCAFIPKIGFSSPPSTPFRSRYDTTKRRLEGVPPPVSLENLWTSLRGYLKHVYVRVARLCQQVIHCHCPLDIIIIVRLIYPRSLRVQFRINSLYFQNQRRRRTSFSALGICRFLVCCLFTKIPT